MRRILIHAYCDACAAKADPDEIEVDPGQAVTVTVAGVMPRQLDLCDEHRAELYEPIAKLFAEHGVRVVEPPPPRAPRPYVRKAADVAMWTCPACDREMQRHSAPNHLITVHGATSEPQPSECPDCGHTNEFSQSMAAHRTRAHGYNRFGELVAQVTPKPKGRKRNG